MRSGEQLQPAVQGFKPMYEYLQTAFSGPPVFASILLVLVTMYWLLVIVGMVDLDGLDFDLDFDANLEGDFDSMLSIGALPLRWLNIGRVPFMLWMSVFALAFWLTSMLWDTPAGRLNGWNEAAAVIRNGAIATLIAKLLTQPICGVFSSDTHSITALDLIGRECQPTTTVTESRGQAKVDVDNGAPLLLSVRTSFGELGKGERAQIVEYDGEREVYIVRRSPNEV